MRERENLSEGKERREVRKEGRRREGGRELEVFT